MATILLAGVGSALGASVGGGVLGLSSVAIGKAVGATLGRAIDTKILGGGSDPVETGRVDRFRLTGASEGAAIPHLYGRARLAGQVIWATKFKEHSETTGGGKGAPSQPQVTSYNYTISLALALCEGEITRVGRVWADGKEIPTSDLNMRVYPGDETQLPDPKIEASMGRARRRPIAVRRMWLLMTSRWASLATAFRSSISKWFALNNQTSSRKLPAAPKPWRSFLVLANMRWPPAKFPTRRNRDWQGVAM